MAMAFICLLCFFNILRICTLRLAGPSLRVSTLPPGRNTFLPIRASVQRPCALLKSVVSVSFLFTTILSQIGLKKIFMQLILSSLIDGLLQGRKCLSFQVPLSVQLSL